jgi:hypothetical protein
MDQSSLSSKLCIHTLTWTGLMVGKKDDEEQNGRTSKDESLENERHQPEWIRRYLDLADLLMRRRKHKNDDEKPKAA